MRQPLFLLYIVNNNNINKETELSTQQFIYLHKYTNYEIQSYEKKVEYGRMK